MESAVFISLCRPSKKNILNISMLGCIYIFIALLFIYIVPNSVFIILFCNGFLNIVIPIYHYNLMLEQELSVTTINIELENVVHNDIMVIQGAPRLPVWKTCVLYIKDDIDCVICGEKKDIRAHFNNCKHSVCYSCILNMVKNECPFCRAIIVTT